MKLLLVDSNPRVCATLRGLVTRYEIAQRWRISDETSTSRALVRATSETFDLVATDLRFGRQEMSGFDLIGALRATSPMPPILVYTAEPWTEAERAATLVGGADDVMGSPIDAPLEFVARVTALCRRTSSERRIGRITIGNLRVDVLTRRVHVDERVLDLTHDQYTLLIALVTAFPRPVSFSDLAFALGYESAHHRGAVIEAIRRLRSRLGDAKVAIVSVKAFGYCIASAAARSA